MPYRRKKPKKKEKIPKALREQVWIKHCGKKFETKCRIHWCNNYITVFDYHVGHDKPSSLGGKMQLNNLLPICSRCNLSMSNNYTIKEWNRILRKKNNNCCNNCCTIS